MSHPMSKALAESQCIWFLNKPTVDSAEARTLLANNEK